MPATTPSSTPTGPRRTSRRGRLASRVLAAGTALLASLGLGATLAPAAHAAPGTGNIVAFGDSFAANPDQVRNTLHGVPGPIGDWADDYPQTAGCLQSPQNFPRQLSQVTGRTVDDYSCSGISSGSMITRINQAINAGVLNNDSTVVLAVGMNDFGPFGYAENGTGLIDPVNVAASYRSNMASAAARIRSVAPGASIVVPGTLPTVDRDTMMYCPLNVVPNMPAGLPIPLLRDVENWNRENQKTAAADIGATYVEVIDGARGHDSCAADTERYVAGIIDTTTPGYMMMFHPSTAGSRYLAETVAPHV
ncbi:MAG: GDSL-type esterase/lipase family protein [Corynebacterium sp.]|nr:GDSL-type esterase/lipase family protein [Corynebacterium sp.]MDN6323838.1 GDSL-type esterase/lipase family protein [Corynebacterium sp.]MDN6386528.1 GDSL-type esterase/lipase family protein [Corynebacterium sp.]